MKFLGRNGAGGRRTQAAFAPAGRIGRVGPDIVAKGRVTDGEGEFIGRNRWDIGDVGRLVVANLICRNLGLGKAAVVTQNDPAVTFRPQTTADIHLNLALCRARADGIDQLVAGGGVRRVGWVAVGVGNGQHRCGDGSALGTFADGQSAAGAWMQVGQRRVIVVGSDGQADGGCYRCRGRAGAAASICDSDAVRRCDGPGCVGFGPVLEKLELG